MQPESSAELSLDTAPPAPATAEATVQLRRWVGCIFAACVAAQVLLVVLDYTVNYADLFDYRSIRRIWNIAREESVPTWFSSTQTVCVGLVAFAIGAVARIRGAGRLRRLGWFGVGVWFVYLGVDDASEIHERVGSYLGSLVDRDPEGQVWLVRQLQALPSYNWQSFIAPVYAVLLLASIGFAWLHLRHYGLRSYLIGGCLLFFVSQALDFVEGLDDIEAFYQSLADRGGVSLYLVTHTFKVVEEVFEMLGTTLFLVGFLAYLSIVADGLTLHIAGTPAGVATVPPLEPEPEPEGN